MVKMNLKNLKSRIYEEKKQLVLDSIRQGVEIEETIFTPEQIEEFKEEVVILDYEEIVEGDIDDFDEAEAALNLHEEDDDDCGCHPHEADNECQCPKTYLDFVPMEDGEEYDLEFAIEDRTYYDDAIENYLKIKDALFAEDYEVHDVEVMQEDGTVVIDEKMARVIFKRSKGTITKKKKCMPGMRLAGRRCLPQTGTQKAKMKRLGIKLKRAKKAMGAAKKKKAARIAKITKKRIKGRTRSLASLSN
jgi:hypothetical protein